MSDTWDVYKVGEHEHVRELDDPALREIGQMLHDNVTGICYWQQLARRMGVGDQIDSIEALPDCTNKAYEVLKAWRKGDASTIFALRKVLGVMRRQDVAKKLEELQRNDVFLPVIVMKDGKEQHDMSGICPGRVPLIEFIRPQVYRKMSLEMLRKNQQLVLRITNRPDVTWTSQAKLLQGQELRLEKISVESRQEQSERVNRRTSCFQQVGDRNFISWVDDSGVYFENATSGLLSSDSEYSSNTSSPIEFENPP